MYLLSTSGPFTLMSRSWQAAAAAATTCVLPQPGGPYSNTPVLRRRGALQDQILQRHAQMDTVAELSLPMSRYGGL